jgi:SNF2 family DNA or RNA helicase
MSDPRNQDRFVFWFHPTRAPDGSPRRYDETLPRALAALPGVQIVEQAPNMIAVRGQEAPLAALAQGFQGEWSFLPSRSVQASAGPLPHYVHYKPSPDASQASIQLHQTWVQRALQGTSALHDPYVPDVQLASNDAWFRAKPQAVRAFIEAERLSWGHLYNPNFATELALIDPLPHQWLAVYRHMLPQPRLRFFLADDAGAGKTIMTGLYLREMIARASIRRVLIVPPAGLVGNWERELRTLFALRFSILKGSDLKRSNPFTDPKNDLAIVSVDTLAGDKFFDALRATDVPPYDLVVFDEAHKLGADRDDELGFRATERYRLAEALCGVPFLPERWQLHWAAQHVLLLSATPHMGKDFPYFCLWRLLEPYTITTPEALQAQTDDWKQARFLRRTKEEMVNFDGQPLYPRRECHTLSYPLSQGPLSEQTLYEEVTAYIQKHYNLAQIFQKSAVRFAMSIFQRRLASSTWATLCSLKNRLAKVEDIISKLQANLQTPQTSFDLSRFDLPNKSIKDPFEPTTPDEEEPSADLEQNERETDALLGSFVKLNLPDLRTERDELLRLLKLAQHVHALGAESKFLRLQEWLRDANLAQEKLLIFTEHRDTANFLLERLEQLGLANRIAFIHGALPWKDREEQARSFNTPLADGGAQWLIATDAAAEGINLQRQCWLMVNYDIPWNPARLEQRMGRIHRYGQTHDPVFILNLVAQDTREGQVMETLLRKLESIREQLSSDKVFDVVGRLFENFSIRDIMESIHNKSNTSLDDAKDHINSTLTQEQVRALQAREAKLAQGGGDVRKHLPDLQAQRKHGVFSELLPGSVASFLTQALPLLGLQLKGDLASTFQILDPDRAGRDDKLNLVARSLAPSLSPLAFTVHRSHADRALWLHPGEPAFDLLAADIHARYEQAALQGAAFSDPSADQPYLLYVFTDTLRREADLHIPSLATPQLLSSRIVAVRQSLAGECETTPIEQVLLLQPAQAPKPPDDPQALQRLAASFVQEHIQAPALEDLRQARAAHFAQREQEAKRGFALLEADLLLRRKRLSDKVRQGDEAANIKLSVLKRQLAAFDTQKQHTLGALQQDPKLVRALPPNLLAWAYVSPHTSAAEQAQQRAELIAIRAAIHHELQFGAHVREVHNPILARAANLQDWPGFDLLSQRPDEAQPRCIEVKGRLRAGEIELTSNEWAKAATLRSLYWLYVVFDCETDYPQLLRIQDPFQALIAQQHARFRFQQHDLFAAAQPE